jgi:PPK2 family polyphosphate:nucleotide phosphotransferase
MDTSGKSGTINHVLAAVNPLGLRVTSFKAPSSSELAHDYLWRVHANVPRAGELAAFDRSHYEDVVVVRVERLVPEQTWRRRFAHINAFEQLLVDEGTTVVKVLLHISREEQGKRLQARLDDPDKHWKVKAGDFHARTRWDDYMEAYEDALEATGTEHAPWHVVPADKKWYRNWAVATILLEAVEALDLQWPAPEVDPSTIVIP